MSCWRAPWAATDGEIPLKVMSPAVTMVTAACAMRALSTLEKAKTVTMPAALTGAVVEDGAAVGTAAGALYSPVLSTEPQLLLPVLQSALSILAVTSKVTSETSGVGRITELM